MKRNLSILILAILAASSLLLLGAVGASAEEGAVSMTTTSSTVPPEGPGTGASASTTTTSGAPQPSSGEGAQSGQAPSGSAEATTSETTTQTTSSSGAPSAPEVQAQQPQAPSRSGQGAWGGSGSHRAGATSGHGGSRGSSPERGLAHRQAPAPSALTPPLPSTLSLAGTGVPDFFISTFSIPPFLLPIYQAAGAAYDVPWQVLAAINEVETDYGRDVNVSVAGAEGWMQFLPSVWQQFGVDATGNGFEDPYNPADAIFAAARYLAAAGASHDVRAAIYAYNHSRPYVESVMLRAELLGGTPPNLLSAITGLSEARFPVHAKARFSDGFPVIEATAWKPARTLVGTVIYSEAGAPVIAVQDGRITRIGHSPTLGSYVSLRDAYGNVYTYAELGNIASLYPVLAPREAPRQRPSSSGGAGSSDAPTGQTLQPPAAPPAAPTGPGGSAGPTGSTGPTGSAGPADSPGPTGSPGRAGSAEASMSSEAAAGAQESFQAGPEEVYLHPLRVGAKVLAGTILGRVGFGGGERSAPAGAGGSASSEPHILFQIRPGGVGSSLIDPKPILDGWVELEDTSLFKAKGQNPFAQSAPTPGEVLLESKGQLEQQVLEDPEIEIYRCGRDDVEAGRIDRRVLATLEFLSASHLRPTVSALACGHRERGLAGAFSGYAEGDAMRISAIDGVPVDQESAPRSPLERALRKLLALQGTMKPLRIAAPVRFSFAPARVKLSTDASFEVSFSHPHGANARLARSSADLLTPAQWVRLVDRLGQIPTPVVRSGHSPASIPDLGSQGGGSNGNG